MNCRSHITPFFYTFYDSFSANPILFSVPYELKALFFFLFLFFNLLNKPSGGFGSSIHNCTIFDRIRDFKMAIFRNGVIGLLIQILSSVIISEKLLIYFFTIG